MNGTVKWFDAKKGFGFITNEEGKDIFVHWSGVIGEGFKKLAEGDAVVFDASEAPKGLCAINVVVES